MKAKVLDLRPTQFAVGMLEVDEKIKAIKDLGRDDLKKYVDDNVVPVVRSYDNELYVVDKHHFLSVCYHVGIKKVKVDIIKDFVGDETSNYETFWEWMSHSRNSYPFCQFGEGPRDAIYFPQDIRGLADDPYRSMAWFVRKAGGFENSDKNFAEFQWANYFRSKKLLGKHGRKGFPDALVEAVKLAQSSEAKDLPGYGKLTVTERKEVEEAVLMKGTEVISGAERLVEF